MAVFSFQKMRLKFHVTYKSSKRIIEHESANERGNVDEITKSICEQFKIPRDGEQVQLQYFDKDFGDWVDVAPMSSLENMTRLQVLMTAAHSDNEHDEAVPTPVSECSGESPKASEGPTLSTTTSPKTFRVWPVQFNFPVYALRAGVLQKLRSGEKLSRGERTQITDAVYQEVTKYTYYPKEWQYTEVVTAFMEKFPKVKSNENLSMSLWRQRIQYRFQNDRRRRDCVPGKRRLADPTSTAAGPPPTKNDKLMWGLKNYISQRPEGEDSTSIERHQAAMKVELAKRNPDRSRVDRLMALTFADRREFIIKGNPLMADIKARFPALLAGGSEVFIWLLAGT
ncbi:uncharacterized protein LOC119732924 [Patiria miniata]|uniref:PB1 domain-containing protein n=1 Tax=Patiria miniata TaxID=46514 RepID=A0A914AFZ2_PATMI|nr:uncharacterized protein LOC119732924 [Patiria miniata]